ncbi:hypothetical protein DV711_14375 [Motiliproteus coralliicola]|uniref:Solute-binding protein family 3/N-terminal domain-containing protein n=1 Tax=Motiliproteus coralliicola TaxID=2283196 RepID=A0A369WAH0_9GAMM|nr:transporter substrate-binding domain-containing protein [Motiliproteus coralliicola]RDE18802.1 hypothetical protein DV711_14375 [Motiliproteus coralliicola]
MYPRLRLLVILVALVQLFTAIPASADELSKSASTTHELVLAADPWCPYNCEPGAESPGFMVELARAALAEDGIHVHYRTMPWTRAMQQARIGEVDGVIGAERFEAEGLVVPLRAFGVSTQGIALRRDDPMKWQGTDSIGARRVAFISGYDYAESVAVKAAELNPDATMIEFTGDDALERMLLLLARQRVDLVVDDLNVLQYKLKQLGLERQLRIVSTDVVAPVYISLSPRLKEAALIADKLDEGIERLRESGEFDRILARYRIQSWTTDPADPAPFD